MMPALFTSDFRLHHCRRALRLSACSGGGNSSTFKFLDLRRSSLPSGPSFVLGRIEISELLRFTLPGSRPNLGLLAVFSESLK